MDAHATDGQPSRHPETGSSELAQLSNGMVRLYKELFGRGPTKARTSYADPDLIVSTLRDSLSRAESNMAAAGDHTRLRELRMYFQYRHEEEFVAVVEEITGRKVEAFVSGMDTRRDVASELFYLAPRA
jgi:uncharacterized protein YbcI